MVYGADFDIYLSLMQLSKSGGTIKDSLNQTTIQNIYINAETIVSCGPAKFLLEKIK